VYEPGNEIGTTVGLGRPVLPRAEVERRLGDAAGHPVQLPQRAAVSGPPAMCPACGSGRLMWGCDPDQTRDRDEIHPLVWHETEWMADSFICRDCDAGWIQPDDAGPVTWVRPYWVVS